MGWLVAPVGFVSGFVTVWCMRRWELGKKAPMLVWGSVVVGLVIASLLLVWVKG